MIPALGSLAEQLERTQPLLQEAPWCTEGVQKKIIAAVALAHALPGLRLSAYLHDQGVISREQAGDLDAVQEQQVHFPNFRLLRRIGAGGMGTVFLAERRSDNRRIALKTLHHRLAMEGDFVSRFDREAKALAGIHHPHIAEVIDSGEVKGHLYLALEFIDGPSLMAMVKDYKQLPETYALGLIRQICEGLAEVWNTSGLVHRDIKPENILVCRDAGGGDTFTDKDLAKLIDFGLVKPTLAGSDDDERARLTQTGMTIGTPLYMSPEQIRGDTLDCRSDIYALGVTLFHLLTGKVPYAGTSPGSIMSAHLTEAVPSPGKIVPTLSEGACQLVMKCMAKKADDRYPTHEALAKALAKVATGGTSTVKFLRKPLKSPPPRPKPAPVPSPLPQLPQLPQLSTQPATSENPAPAPSGNPVPGSGRVPPSIRSPMPTMPRAAQAATPLPAPESKDPPSGQRVHSVEIPDLKPLDTTQRSRVFDEDPKAQGVGMLPWLVLAAAIVILALYFILV